jgi:hypothetical protein
MNVAITIGGPTAKYFDAFDVEGFGKPARPPALQVMRLMSRV